MKRWQTWNDVPGKHRRLVRLELNRILREVRGKRESCTCGPAHTDYYRRQEQAIRLAIQELEGEEAERLSSG